ncbi:MAG TPA: SDR family NAD(P)-dependent oxidoreductase [Candidatus Dormibacteraeota bacterium]
MADTAPAATPIYPDLKGKVAVVTGGSRGIGRCTCDLLAANEAKVAVVARDQRAIDRVVDTLRDGGAEAIGVSADVMSYPDIERMRGQVEAELGPADLLIPFAGGFAAYTRTWEITEEEWHAVLDSNLTSTFLTCKSFLPGMIERNRGAIVTMASNGGRFLDILLTSSYAAAKAAIVMFTRHLAKEVGEYGIRVNCVAPATVLSERVTRIMTPERIEEVAALSPLGRIGDPEDAALAALFLLSDSARWITGVTLDVAGGRIML